MPSRRSNPRHDPVHLAEVHERWMMRRNRRQEDPDYRDEWWAQQCGMCRFWIALQPPLGHDFGVCTNPASQFDGRVQFEHDGCENFEQAVEWAEAEESL
jgi:hypothetical protein